MEHSITLKNIDKALFQKLKAEAKRQGKDLNTLLIQLIEKFFSSGNVQRKKSDKKKLEDLAGTWSSKEYREFLKNTAAFNEVDEQLWK